MSLEYQKEIQYIKGVGEARAKTLNKLGIYNLEDLITYFPRDYEDRSKIKKLNEVIERRRSINKSICRNTNANNQNKKEKYDNMQNDSQRRNRCLRNDMV